jgi:hypothetical protein
MSKEFRAPLNELDLQLALASGRLYRQWDGSDRFHVVKDEYHLAVLRDFPGPVIDVSFFVRIDGGADV